MTKVDLEELNKMGFIPGPGEDEGAFCARVERAKDRFLGGEWVPEGHWHWVREFLAGLFDVKPLYIGAFYSNRGLALWQGAASWIEGRDLCSIQMREGMRKGTYLRLYRREEILAHEAVHAARSGFNEGRFEEFFAYMTSEKRWRRVLGPLVRRPWEVWPFFGMMVGGMVWPECYWAAVVWIGIGFLRLIRGHAALKRASEAVLREVRDERKARAILFRMTDREIEALARGGKVRGMVRDELRWKVIEQYLE